MRWCFWMVLVAACLLTRVASAHDFIRGDADGDGQPTVADAVVTLGHLFLLPGTNLPCQSAADVNDDDAVNLADVIVLLSYLFLPGSPSPPAPFPDCGSDPTPSLPCNTRLCSQPHPGLSLAGLNVQGYEEYTLDIDPTVVLILIPGGTFNMGQAGTNGLPIHQVTLSPYFISKHEITNAQYRLYCDSTGAPYPPPPAPCCGVPNDYFTNPIYGDFPVVLVSWDDLNAPGSYLEWAGLVLPSEAQWEFAARGTDQRSYPWGSELPDFAGLYRANYAASPNDADGFAFTCRVDEYPSYSGPFGTLNQAGNAEEWCQDLIAAYPPGAVVDPTGPLAGTYPVVRGGSWGEPGAFLLSAIRNFFSPFVRLEILGFRAARVAP